MKKIFLLFCVFILGLLPLVVDAQQVGEGMYNPIIASSGISNGYIDASAPYTDTQSYNNGFGWSGYNQYAIYYQFSISAAGNVNISTCQSTADTYVVLYDANGNPIASNDDDGPLCTGTSASLSESLSAGTYYVMVQPNDPTVNGSIVTTISTDVPLPPPPPPGIYRGDPIPAGQFGLCTGTGPFNDSKNNGPSSGYMDQGGQPSNDIFYSFDVTNPTTMNISLCGSDFSTYLHLYQVTFETGSPTYTEIAAANDGTTCPGLAASIQQLLPRGYYLVEAEGNGYAYGNMQISIYSTPNTAPPPAGSSFVNAISAGTITPSAPFSNIFVPTDCYEANSTGGVNCYYQFILSAAGEVSISNCGSADNATLMQLVNKTGKIFATANMEGPLCTGYQASIKTGLPADTYYVMITGFPTDPSITTTINVAAPTSLSAIDGLNVSCSPLVTSLPTNQNYLLTYSPRIPLTDLSSISSYTTCDINQNITYVDGLGRPVQTVQVNGSPDGTKDVIQPIAYDQFGREATKYLPYNDVANHGLYRPNALGDAAGIYLNSDQYNFYTNPNQNYQLNLAPHSNTVFEASPQNRPLEQGAPGMPWQLTGTVSPSGEATGHTVKMVYAVYDNSTFIAKKFGVGTDATTGLPILLDQGSYDAGQLYVTVTKDENWTSAQTDARLNTTEEYKDKDGHVLLKRIYNYNTGVTPSVFETLSTYYVYDDIGNLTFVLPPKAEADGGLTSTANAATITNLCYQYNYDERQRLIAKRIPGKDWEYTVYNAYDQVVATQDGNQRQHNQWTIAKYDALGRGIVTGLWDNSNTAISPANLRTAVYGQGGRYENKDNSQTYGYTLNQTYPTSLNTVLSVNYFDSYNLPGGNPYPYTYDSQVNGMPTTASAMLQSLPTATWTTVLNTIGNTTPDMLWSVMYYDDKGRVIQTKAQHYLGGTVNAGNYDQVSNGYDFTGEVVQTLRKHYTTSAGTNPAVTIANTFDYDHVGRKRRTWEKINNQDNIITSQLEYNEIGQLYQKNLHGLTSSNGVSGDNLSLGAADAMTSGTRSVIATHRIALNPGFSVTGSATFSAKIASFLQTITYAYNERGWLTSANTDGNLFNYSLNYNAPGTGITPQFNGNISGMVYNVNKPTTATHQFTYTYDALNRLINAASTGNALDEAITYDKMGNISSLTRGGSGAVSMNYNYADANGNYSNQLSAVSDAGNNGLRTYGYDWNGNATSDGNATTANGGRKNITYNLFNLPQTVSNAATNVTIASYTYEANGTKLRNIGSDGTWDYISGIVYQNNAISFIQTEEGRANRNADGSYSYEYNLKDHLGNVRISFDKNTATGQAELIQEDEYYAFGLRHGLYDNSNNNRYLYNGKERQTDLTDQYDYGARFYDPVTVRWNTPDPLAEKSRRFSPYVYGKNNPIRFIDPDGMFDVDINGPEKQKALAELQKSVQGQLNLSMDANGKVSYTTVQGATPNANATQLTTAIDDHSITVNVNTTAGKTTANGQLFIGGAFGGNTVTAASTPGGKATVVANQDVNPTVLGAADAPYGKPGANTLHEVTEAYQGAKMSQTAGTSSGVAGTPGSVYPAAHAAATPQAGPIYQRIYDASGRELQMTPSGGYPAGVQSADWYVNGPQNTKVVIQTLP